eukprot:4057675-Ditylum_brightwellii.AAC.1
MVIFSKPLNAVKSQGNSPQDLKPIIPMEHPKVCKLTKGNYHTNKLCMYDLAIPFFKTGSVEELL